MFGRRLATAAALVCAFASAAAVAAAENATGLITGSVVAAGGAPVAGAQISAESPAGRSSAATDGRGRFTLARLVPATYTLSVTAAGFAPLVERGVAVVAGEPRTLVFRVTVAPKTIGSVQAANAPFVPASAGGDFTVAGRTARASAPPGSSSGLGKYAAGTVQGAIAAVPGVRLDPFANAILRGGKVGDAVYEYDSVPLPQGLIAEPGGNIAGAQLATTGVAATTVSLAGYQAQNRNALGGIIDQIPATGTYPGSTTVELATGVAGSRLQLAGIDVVRASPDQRRRFAFAATFGGEDFAYGDGRSFYPAEAATYGVGLRDRAQFSVETNVHVQLRPADDVSLLVLAGQAAYDQYGTPYAGETSGAFNGAALTYPNAPAGAQPVRFASGVRGAYDVIKVQWLHAGTHGVARVQLYQSRSASSAGGPYWDENGFPNGTFSLLEDRAERETGLGYDGETIGEHHHLRYGATVARNDNRLDQTVPTFDDVVTSQPRLTSSLAYAGDEWHARPRLDVAGAARFTRTTVAPQAGPRYAVAAVDPHAAVVYHLGTRFALRTTFDHTTVGPQPLEADRTDSADAAALGRPAPFVRLAPQTADDFGASVEGGGSWQFRATYFAKNERNRIDVLPANYRAAAAGTAAPSPVGVPSNAGELRAHGVELWLRRGGFTFAADAVRAFSSSASQFARASLNAPATAAGHLFPAGYTPDVTSNISYEAAFAHGHVRIAPSIAFESGYPYGNGRLAWIFDPVTRAPIQVPNDNYVNPGANYYFLRDPALPFNAATNPYVASLGTPEGSDPNTLRARAQTLVNLHVEGDVSHRLTAIVDVANLFGTAAPFALQSNPYLVGPPGYAGGNAAYAAALQKAIGSAQPYVLGNGVPTNDGVTQAVPWTYGRGAYVPQSYPLARSIAVRLRYRW